MIKINNNILLLSAFLCFFLYFMQVNAQQNNTQNTTKVIPTIPERFKNSKVNWMTFEQAILAREKDKKAGKKPKKMLVSVYTNWCGWCKKMDAETYEDEKVYSYLNSRYYPVKLDAEYKENITYQGYVFKFIADGKRGYHELAAALLEGQMSYPAMLLFNEEFKMLQRILGYTDARETSVILKYIAEDHYFITPWYEFLEKNSK